MIDRNAVLQCDRADVFELAEQTLASFGKMPPEVRKAATKTAEAHTVLLRKALDLGAPDVLAAFRKIALSLGDDVVHDQLPLLAVGAYFLLVEAERPVVLES